MRVYKKPGVTGGQWASEVVSELQPTLVELVDKSKSPLADLRALIIVTWGRAATMVFHKDSAQSFRDRLAAMPLDITNGMVNVLKSAVEQFDELVAAPATGLLPTLVIGFEDDGLHVARFQVQIGEGFPS